MRHTLFAALLLLAGCCTRPPQRETTTVVQDSLVTFPPSSVSLSQSLAYDAVQGFTPFAVIERQGRAQVSATLDPKGKLQIQADCPEEQVLIKKVKVYAKKEVPVVVTKLPWYFYPLLLVALLLGAALAYAVYKVINFLSLK
jgi:hypothetical protein